MTRRLFSYSLMTAGLALSVGACTSPDLSQLCTVPPNATKEQVNEALLKCFPGQGNNVVDTRLNKDVDILFVIDNSASMTPKQREIGKNLSNFFNIIDATKANYHIGVISTDIGSLTAPNTPFAGSAVPACNTFEGDDGALQKLPCTNRSGVSMETTIACNGGTIMGMTVPALCSDPSFVPGSNKSFIDVNKAEGTSNVKQLMMNGVDVGPLRAFQCIGLIGDGGCGIESPLEAARRALDGHRPENAGFLRQDSVLAIIWITDEDDCSVQQAKRADNDPNTVTSFTSGGMTYQCADATARTNANMSGVDIPARCYGLDYRCLARDIVCDQPMNAAGVKTNCKSRTDTYLEPLDKYVTFFSRLRSNDKLVLAGIWTPTLNDNPNGNQTMDGKVIVRQEPTGAPGVAGLNRGYKTEAGCYDPSVPINNANDVAKGFIGQAQTRLSTFIRRFDPAIRVEKSICDSSKYPEALQLIANKIQRALGAECLAVKPNRYNVSGTYDGVKGTAACQVGYVDSNNRDATPDTLFPQCSETCCRAFANGDYLQPSEKDPAIIAACTPEAADCFCAAESSIDAATGKPKNCANTAVAGLWRKGNAPPPAGKVVNFRCAGVHPPTQ